MATTRPHTIASTTDKAKTAARLRSADAFDQGRDAYRAGKSHRDNPYYHGAYPYTREGRDRQRWHEGFRHEWCVAWCPPDRWPEAANTLAAIEVRAARLVS